MSILKYIVSISLCLLGFQVIQAQEVTVTPEEPAAVDWRPSAIRAGIDAYGIGQSILMNGYSRQELEADMDFHRYFAVFDLGRASSSHSDFSYKENTSGTYFRLGADVNFTPYNKSRDIIFGGVRFGHAHFNQSLTFDAGNPYWGSSPQTFTNSGANASWVELVAGLKVKIWNQFYFGFTLRRRFADNIKGTKNLSPYEIPGFGRTEIKKNYAVSYYIYYRLPFRNKPIPPKPPGTL